MMYVIYVKRSKGEVLEIDRKILYGTVFCGVLYTTNTSIKALDNHSKIHDPKSITFLLYQMIPITFQHCNKIVIKQSLFGHNHYSQSLYGTNRSLIYTLFCTITIK